MDRLTSRNRHWRDASRWLILGLLALLSAGCAPLLKPLIETKQPATPLTASLDEGQSVGQTFVANYDGLAGVFFYLGPDQTGDGEIRLHLRSEAQAAEDLAVSLNTLRVDAVHGPGWYEFYIPAQAQSNQVYYYAFLEVQGSGRVQAHHAAGNAYLDGGLYLRGEPQEAQAAFQLSYSRRAAASGLAREMIGWLGILVVSAFLFILPGWGLMAWLLPNWDGLRWPEKTGLSAGLSLALYPLLLLWTNAFGLSLGAAYAWIPPIGGAALLIWRAGRKWRSGWRPALYSAKSTLCSDKTTLPADLALAGILLLLIFSRFWVIRSFEIPLWGDSYQHTIVTQLIINHNGLFDQWMPYADIHTFTYHFGFHSAAAVFHWMTKLESMKAVLWSGQILNVLAVLALYPLAARLKRNPWAGTIAVLVSGLLTTMPMFYTNWGRYTQLAGQVVLPAAVWIIWEYLERPAQTLKEMITHAEQRASFSLASLLAVGLALNHYRITVFLIIWLILFWLITAADVANLRQQWRGRLLKTGLLAVGSAILFSPWLLRIFAGNIPHVLSVQLNMSASAAVQRSPEFNSIGNLFFYLPAGVWLLLPFVVGWGLWQRKQDYAVMSTWWLSTLWVANPQWLNLPGVGVINGMTVLIAFYIPGGILLGWAAVDLAAKLPKLHPGWRWGQLALALCSLGAALWGVPARIQEIHPEYYTQATRPDQRAAAWIQENLPTEARFLVNTFIAMGGSLAVSSDGGGWLPYLAQRSTLLPPTIYGFEERTSSGEWLKQLTLEIHEKTLTNDEVLNRLRQAGITHFYIGQQQGAINSGGALFSPATLSQNPAFKVVYHRDRVWIFELLAGQ